MNLDEFIVESKNLRQNRAHLDEPGFKALYVRLTFRYVAGKMYQRVLDLASIEADRKGKGAFTALLNRIRSRYPDLHIYVECVINQRFAQKLEALGFEQVTPLESPCYFLEAKASSDDSSKQ
jgi:hypothetical protein